MAIGLWYMFVLAAVLMASIEAAHSETWMPIANKALSATEKVCYCTSRKILLQTIESDNEKREKTLT